MTSGRRSLFQCKSLKRFQRGPRAFIAKAIVPKGNYCKCNTSKNAICSNFFTPIFFRLNGNIDGLTTSRSSPSSPYSSSLGLGFHVIRKF